MMIRPKIGLDWDDVVAPFNSIAIEMANKKHEFKEPLTLEDISSWENTGRASVIKEFYSDIKLYEEQSRRISEETKKNVRRLMEFADVYFITAVGEEFMSVRAAQIREAFPELPNGRVILGAAKYLVQFDVTLDDNICNVLKSPSTFPVLMRKPWNKNMTGLLSVNNLGEFVVLVEHIYGVNAREDKDSTPRVIALVGPSGSGKNEIAKALTERFPQFERPSSYSTKKFSDGSHVWLSEEDFKKKNFFEQTMYAGHRYGTQKEDIKAVLDSKKNAVLPLDMCGAIAMKREFPTTIIYVKKGKVDLISDIVASDFSNEEKTLRLLSLEAERKNSKICDITVEGGDVENAVKTIIETIK